MFLPSQILFSTLNVPALNLPDEAVLSLLNNGIFSGVVVSLGHTVARIMPVVEGYPERQYCKLLDSRLTGEQATIRVKKLLENSEVEHTRSVVEECGVSPGFAQAVKETLCYVPKHYNQRLLDTYDMYAVLHKEWQRWRSRKLGPDMLRYEPRQNVDPEGQYVTTEVLLKNEEGEEREMMISAERCAAPESIFDPSRLDIAKSFEAYEGPPDVCQPGKKMGRVDPVAHNGLAGQVLSVLEDCRGDRLLRDAIRTVVLTGGNVSYPGFATRLANDLEGLSKQVLKPTLWQPSNQVKISASPTRDVWQGGSILASHPTVTWVTRQEFLERGTNIMHDRFF